MATTKTFEMIANSSLPELRAYVLEAKLSPTATQIYTRVLSDEEEMAAVKKLVVDVKAERSAWLAFIAEYSLKYPLCNNAVEYLIKHSGIEAVCALLFSLFSRYSYTAEQGIQICKLADRHNNEQINRLLEAVCNFGRIYEEQIYSLLQNIDLHDKDKKKSVSDSPTISLAEAYKKGVEKYRREHELLKYTESKKTRFAT